MKTLPHIDPITQAVSVLFNTRSEPKLQFKLWYSTLEGTDLWFLEQRFLRPWFLKCQFIDNWFRLFRFQIAYFGRRLALCSSYKSISISSSSDSIYAKLSKSFDRIGFILKRPSDWDSKFIFFAETNQQELFIKIPLTSNATRLIENERSALTELRADPDLRHVVPELGEFEGHLTLKNVKPQWTRHRQTAPQELWRVYELLYSRSITSVPMRDLKRKCLSMDRITDANYKLAEHPPATTQLIERAQKTANAYLDGFSEECIKDCYLAHGDFHFRNVLALRDGKAQVFDWEYFGLKPRYFDIIYYFYVASLCSGKSAEEALHITRDILKERNISQTNQHIGISISIELLRCSTICTYRNNFWKNQLIFPCRIIDALTGSI